MTGTAEATPAVRFVTVGAGRIEPATDLGNAVTLKHGNVYLLTDSLGDIRPSAQGLGLYDGDTRILSRCELRLNGARPALLGGSTERNYEGAIALTNADEVVNPDPSTEPTATIVRRSLGLRRERLLAGGLRERVRIANYTDAAETVVVALDLGFDAADIFEVRGFPRPARGQLLPVAIGPGRVTFRYRGLDGQERSTFVACSEGAEIEAVGEVDAADGDRSMGRAATGDVGASDHGTGTDGLPGAVIRASWHWTIPARGERQLEWQVWSTLRAGSTARPTGRSITDERSATLFPDPPPINPDAPAAAYRAWAGDLTGIDSDNELFNRAIRRSVLDLRQLMNDGPNPGERYLAAGVPWFSTLFGRDTIITALQLLAFKPQLAVETLAVLAARQATTVDPWRDAEPGKILHELRGGEMVRAGELPFSPYYGSIDSTPLWLILLGATFDWTGDRELVDRLWPNALAALDWIDRYGDRDGDGFVEYGRHSERGLVNQGWKDSGDSIRDRYGRTAEGPIALAEVQGYVYDAKRRMAALARVRGDQELAGRLDREAEGLRVRFEAAFWVEDQAWYAMALDGTKQQVDAIASNAGHCLWSGIVVPDRARRVADRLLGPGLFSGWGIRTYARDQPGFNPIGYHTGSVWPHDTSLIAAGLQRYGFHDEANRLVGAMFEAGEHFDGLRLPELFCGFDRDSSEIPVPYPVACSPQSWAAGSTFLFLETMLGLRPHAERRELELIRPQLPAWLGRVRITNLRVGDAAVDLLFHRWRGSTSAEVLRKVGDVTVTIRL